MKVLGDGLTWTSSLDRTLGSGHMIGGRNLTPGLHTVSLTVKDSDSMTDTDEISLWAPASDKDSDDVPDRFDNCPGVPNLDQADTDRNATGNACDPTCATDVINIHGVSYAKGHELLCTTQKKKKEQKYRNKLILY